MSGAPKHLLPKALLLSALILPGLRLSGQVIEFWSNGLLYRTQTRDGLTLMYAHMPLVVRSYAVIQVALNNGSDQNWRVQPTDFLFETSDGRVLRGLSEFEVIGELYRRADRADVMKLQSAYEKALYGNQHIRSNNGYEQRRQNAMAGGPKGIRAAAAASAISFVTTKLSPGDATDGAVFFANEGKPLGEGRLTARLEGQTFEFHSH